MEGKINRAITSILFFCILLFSGTVLSEELIGFEESGVNERTEFAGYTALYIGKVGTKELKVDAEDLAEQANIKDNLAYKARNRFRQALSRVIKITSTKDPSKQTLILDLRLAGTFRETGLLENMIPGVEDRMVMAKVSGSILDGTTREEVVFFSDTYRAKASEFADSAFGVSDEEVWIRALDKWARALTAFLGRKKGIAYTP